MAFEGAVDGSINNSAEGMADGTESDGAMDGSSNSSAEG